jgi:hypothetical protein
MLAGKCRAIAMICDASADFGARRVDIRYQERQDAPAQQSMRTSSAVSVYSWDDPIFKAGRFMRIHDGRLLHIDTVRHLPRPRDIVMSCTELVGESGSYTSGGNSIACRIFLLLDAPTVGNRPGKTEYRTRAEVAVLEVGRPQPGDSLTVGGSTWSVMGLVDDQDDGLIRQMWVKPQ